MSSDAAIEQRTQQIGRRLLADLRRQSPHRPMDWVADRLLGITTSNERLKVELFRFVDALPALTTPSDVTRHLREYLLQPGVKLPKLLGTPLAVSSRWPMVDRMIARAAQFGATQMAKRFIAGATADEAATVVERLRQQNLAFSLDVLGEFVTSPADAARYQQQYLDLIRAMTTRARRWRPNLRLDESPFGPLPRVNVSMKLSALFAGFDPLAADHTAAAVKDALRPILSLARQTGCFINFDMEQNDYRPLTRRIFDEILMEDAFRDWADVGIVIQAYLRDSAEDLSRLLAWAKARGTPVWVRLVKGAYWDYETILAAQRGLPSPVFDRKEETDANFESLSRTLIENWETLRPAIATHNVRSAAHAMAVAQSLHLPAGTVEFQVLLGMGGPIARALSRRGQRVRVYTPFGQLLPGMAYLVRRLLENTSNESFIRHASGSESSETLLAPPNVGSALTDRSRPVRQGGPYISGSCAPSASRDRTLTLPSPGVPGEGLHPHGDSDMIYRTQPSTFRNEPETDFSVEPNQQAMRGQVGVVGGHLDKVVPIVIDGREEISQNLVDRPDPSDTSRVASRVHHASAEQATRAIDAAARAFAGWRDTPVDDRAAALLRVANYFRERRFYIAAWEVFEVGKPWREADADVAEAIDFCVYYAGEMQRLAQPRVRNVPGEWNEYVYEPRGVTAVIAPWNFPLAILTGMTAAALAAGNSVVIKPAEQSSRVGLFLMEAIQAAGIPAGVANFLPGDGEVVGPVLVNDPRVATIAFTGSRAVGLSIIRDAAVVHPGQRHVKRVIAEMGGKNPILIDDDADLDEAIVGVLASATGYAGQKCSACSRVIAIGSAYEPFMAKLKETINTLRIGSAEDPATAVGPVVDAEARDRVLRYIEMGNASAKAQATLAPSPELAARGYFVPVAIFEMDDPHASLCQEEIFGPVLAVLRARDLSHALELADDSPYALTGGFYSRSPANIARVRKEMRVGNLYINRKITGALVDRQPFGGSRLSGVGAKAGGPDYLLQFLSPRTVTESVMRRGFAPTDEIRGE